MRRASSRRVHEHKRRSSLTELLSEKSGQFRSVRSYSVFVLKQLFWYCGLRSVLPIHVVPLHERARIPPVARISGRGTSFPSKRKFACYMWEGYITATRPKVTHTSAARPSRLGPALVCKPARCGPRVPPCRCFQTSDPHAHELQRHGSGGTIRPNQAGQQ